MGVGGGCQGANTADRIVILDIEYVLDAKTLPGKCRQRRR